MRIQDAYLIQGTVDLYINGVCMIISRATCGSIDALRLWLKQCADIYDTQRKEVTIVHTDIYDNKTRWYNFDGNFYLYSPKTHRRRKIDDIAAIILAQYVRGSKDYGSRAMRSKYRISSQVLKEILNDFRSL